MSDQPDRDPIQSPDPLAFFGYVTARTALEMQAEAQSLNLTAGIEWANRERIRTIQGLASKIEDQAAELLYSLPHTPEVKASLDSLWPDDDTPDDDDAGR
jgi:hypothetical protein